MARSGVSHRFFILAVTVLLAPGSAFGQQSARDANILLRSQARANNAEAMRNLQLLQEAQAKEEARMRAREAYLNELRTMPDVDAETLEIARLYLSVYDPARKRAAVTLKRSPKARDRAIAKAHADALEKAIASHPNLTEAAIMAKVKEARKQQDKDNLLKKKPSK